MQYNEFRMFSGTKGIIERLADFKVSVDYMC